MAFSRTHDFHSHGDCTSRCSHHRRRASWTSCGGPPARIYSVRGSQGRKAFSLPMDLRASELPSSSDLDIKVLDGSSDSWLHSWKGNYSACPRDRDGLLAFAHETGAADKCIKIAICVGKSMSKHRRKKKVANGCSVGCSKARALAEIDGRDSKDYYVPSADIFHSFCDTFVHRYRLESLVEKLRVVSIEYDFPDALGLHAFGEQPDTRLFKVKASCGQFQYAGLVVLAVGAGGRLHMPRGISVPERNGAAHSTKKPEKGLLPSYLKQRILARYLTSVIIVGGVLTAAQIADECIARGVLRVVMLMKSEVKRTFIVLSIADNLE